jgi:2-iminoacetate synthase
MIIDQTYIEELLKKNQHASKEDIQTILDKAEIKKGLNHQEIATLLNIEDEDQLQQLLEIAGKIKREIYGNRVVMFAPLYIINY